MKVVADERYSDTNNPNPNARFSIVHKGEIVSCDLSFNELKDYLNLEIRSHFSKVTGKTSKNFNLKEIVSYLKYNNSENWAMNSLVFVNQTIGEPLYGLVKRN